MISCTLMLCGVQSQVVGVVLCSLKREWQAQTVADLIRCQQPALSPDLPAGCKREQMGRPSEPLSQSSYYNAVAAPLQSRVNGQRLLFKRCRSFHKAGYLDL